MDGHEDQQRWCEAVVPGAATCVLPGGYSLWTWAPMDAAAPLPVLWVLDGASLFASMARAVAMLARRGDATGVRPMIVAGIDHDPADRARRDAEYSFGPCRDPAGFAAPDRVGGGEAMIDRIAGPMLAAVAERCPVDATQQMLFGHSLAGSFALHAMAARPSLFRVVGAVSPSIWWDRDAVFERVANMADRGQALFLGAGGREQPVSIQNDADRRRDARGIVREVRAMAELVATRLGEDRVATSVAADEDHASAPLTLMPGFLRFASRTLA